MVFEDSSQAKYFLFEDREALMSCKHRASVVRSLETGCDIDRPKQPTKLIPQSFACGYHHRPWDGGSMDESFTTQHFDAMKNLSPPRRISTSDQEILIHFHAHQMHRLVGPSAIYPELRRSTSTLSTAVMLFRRFYLSNSVIDFPPRPIAAASGLLAVKVDCEPSLPVSFPLCLMFFL
jgi:cyclin H